MCGNTKQQEFFVPAIAEIGDLILPTEEANNDTTERFVVIEVQKAGMWMRARSLRDNLVGLFYAGEFRVLGQAEANAHAFKAGDTVVCVWKKERSELVVGANYLVHAVGDETVHITFDDGDTVPIYAKYFELAPKQKPVVTLEQRTAEARNAAKANMRKRAHLRLLEKQNAELRKALAETKQRNGKLIEANHNLAQRIMQSQLIPQETELSVIKKALAVAILRGSSFTIKQG